VANLFPTIVRIEIGNLLSSSHTATSKSKPPESNHKATSSWPQNIFEGYHLISSFR
jgi:hypothetical protein